MLFAAPSETALAIEPTHADCEYARVEDLPLTLDLYLPAEQANRPLLLWIHGGAWRSGSKRPMPLEALVAAGFPVARVDYRLSPVARFPAQIHDLKAAVRFLRARRAKYNLSTERLIVCGNSAGGHLAALLGTTNGHVELEGSVGEFPDADSSVQGIVSFYGMSNFTTILAQSTPHGLSVRKPALDLLLGGQPEAVPELARLASPVFHVDAGDPPLLLLHGDQDVQAPINQSHELQGRYEELGLSCRFVVVHGAGHGGPEFYDERRLAIVREFLSSLEESPTTETSP